MKTKDKPHIKIFITKNLKFRVKVKEPTGKSYEVTVGGTEWLKGKGREYEKVIRKKCEILVALLEAKLLVFKDFKSLK
jgi:hypothetical protein